MPSVDDIYVSSGGNWLRAKDIDDDAVVTISAWEKAEMKDGAVKLVLSFSGWDKQLVVNFTNSGIISEVYGKDYTKWVGKSLTLFPTKAKSPQGGLVPSIGVRIPKAQRTAAPAAAKPKPDSDDEFDDSIPF